VAKDLYWTIPNGFGAAAVKRHAAKIQEKFAVRRALRQTEGFFMAQHQPTGGLRRLKDWPE